MLNVQRLNDLFEQANVTMEALAAALVRPGMDLADAIRALRNWRRGLFKPRPTRQDAARLAEVLGVEDVELMEWRSSYRYAPLSASKARPVTRLIVGKPVQAALDILAFTRKRAAPMVAKVLRAAIADADEQEADVEALVVKEARVDDAGRRVGTKQFRAKDRGRAHEIRKRACHIHVTITEM
ncbi:MAG: 50S ribosomal protein L22 [Sedimentisphaerales bacterium]|nr:50S ribosomal protein L22 [Sedimentisphaerales bacterium]